MRRRASPGGPRRGRLARRQQAAPRHREPVFKGMDDVPRRGNSGTYFVLANRQNFGEDDNTTGPMQMRLRFSRPTKYRWRTSLAINKLARERTLRAPSHHSHISTHEDFAFTRVGQP